MAIPRADSFQIKSSKGGETESSSTLDTSVLPCIRNRRSIFPGEYDKSPAKDVDPAIIRSLLDAAFGALGMENALAIRIQPNLSSLAERAWSKCKS